VRPTTSVVASTVRALITSVPEASLRELFIEWALAALRCLAVSPAEPTSTDRARRHWSRARRDAHNAQQRERRQAARAGNPNRRGRKGRTNEEKNTPGSGNGRSAVSGEALWKHAAKLEPSAPWRAIVRELGVTEAQAQAAQRDGILPCTPRAAARFMTL